MTNLFAYLYSKQNINVIAHSCCWKKCKKRKKWMNISCAYLGALNDSIHTKINDSFTDSQQQINSSLIAAFTLYSYSKLCFWMLCIHITSVTSSSVLICSKCVCICLTFCVFTFLPFAFYFSIVCIAFVDYDVYDDEKTISVIFS